MDFDEDLEIDYMIGLQLALEASEEEEKRKEVSKKPILSIVDPQLELSDPNPSAHALFVDFNVTYFWGKLGQVMVDWSKRMTRCAGVCSFQPRSGLCSIRLSEPLLALRPRRDLVETLLHEMIHAYIFIVHHDRDRDAHGPVFQSHMHRINAAAGTKITIYHTFHDEVASHQKHWWKCSGPCQHRPPFFGIVKRAMNRAPSPRDFWWSQHQRECGGTYTKIKEPESTKTKGRKNSESSSSSSRTIKGGILIQNPSQSLKSPPNSRKREGTDIRNFFSPKTAKIDSSPSAYSFQSSIKPRTPGMPPQNSKIPPRVPPQSSKIPPHAPPPSSKIPPRVPPLSSKMPPRVPPLISKTTSLVLPPSSKMPPQMPHQNSKIPPHGPSQSHTNHPADVKTQASGTELFRKSVLQSSNIRTIQESNVNVTSSERFPGQGKAIGGSSNGRSRLLSLYGNSN